MMIELQEHRLKCESQKSLKVFYEGIVTGDYYADIVVNNCVIIELKAVEAITPEHKVQFVNYLNASEIEVGLLFNFGREPEFKHRVFSKNYSELSLN
jgi:GxxExxY protein